jgi:hypothetical protein
VAHAHASKLHQVKFVPVVFVNMHARATISPEDYDRMSLSTLKRLVFFVLLSWSQASGSKGGEDSECHSKRGKDSIPGGFSSIPRHTGCVLASGIDECEVARKSSKKSQSDSPCKYPVPRYLFKTAY